MVIPSRELVSVFVLVESGEDSFTRPVRRVRHVVTGTSCVEFLLLSLFCVWSACAVLKTRISVTRLTAFEVVMTMKIKVRSRLRKPPIKA